MVHRRYLAKKITLRKFLDSGTDTSQGNLKQGLAASDPSCAESLQQEVCIFSTAHQRGVGNFYKIPFVTYLLDADSTGLQLHFEAF